MPHLPPALLALDLDGTLVEPRKPVRATVIAAVHRAQAAGVRVTIVTGRMYVGAKPFADALTLDGPIVLYQGAVLADARTGRFEREVSLKNSTALRIYAAAKENGLHVQFYRDDRFYVEEDNAYAQLYARTSGTQPVVVASLPAEFAGRDSTKVNVVTDIARTPEVLALMERVCGRDAYVTRSNPEFVEMLSPEVDKGVALRLVAEGFGIPMERVMAIGDSYNDLPLLRAAGFGVAMGSSPNELKAEADAVVADVEHDGVVEAIEKFVLTVPEADPSRT
ncbi:MAG: HAD family phosphatase [Candidatus Eremiobacteraeota bacterium]|nr:HAD family phosphatase [Candidatus Eremiobacteraeota bacterium]